MRSNIVQGTINKRCRSGPDVLACARVNTKNLDSIFTRRILMLLKSRNHCSWFVSQIGPHVSHVNVLQRLVRVQVANLHNERMRPVVLSIDH